MAGSWSIGIGEQSQGGLLVDCGKWPEGCEEMWKCWKARQPWKQGITADHVQGGIFTVASLPKCQHQQLNNRERPQRGWPVKCLMHRVTGKDPSKGGHLSTDAKQQKRITA